LDGLTIARERIAREAEEKTGFLDLGDLGLFELPNELFQLKHLQRINCAYTQVSDLAPLASLTNLQSLDCSITQVSDLAPLAPLTNLQSLDCSRTQVSDLAPLARLTNLQTLNCSDTQVSDLAPLESLTNLQTLNCDHTQVSDLAPLQSLANLQELECWNTKVSDLAPIMSLTHLQKVDCTITQVSDLAPLRSLINLQEFSCSITQVSDLAPLAHLTNLQTLFCARTEVSDLAALRGLTNLQTLYFGYTQVSDLSPLRSLTKLQDLRCTDTEVRELAPLEGLTNLQMLDCSGCRLSSVPKSLLLKSPLKELYLYQAYIPGIPAEVLSKREGENCLDSLRAHLRDLDAGREAVTDIKLMVLGNGQVGKTQICRRLRGEAYDVNIESTHGILVTSAPLPGSQDKREHLQIWDFGGQDIYHGTHALFMRTRAVFALVWIPEAEKKAEHIHGGIMFRNRPLAYWLDYVKHFSGAETPVLVVQTRCDRPEDEILPPPVENEALAAFPFKKVLHYSAKKNRGRAALDEALHQAAVWLRERQGAAEIGAGRARVKERLEAMRDEDAKRPPAKRQWRSISHDHFLQLCQEAGGVSSTGHLLSYLHNSGIVFYREGLFGDRIIIDQSWALESIYAVFHREKCLQRLQRQKGRFTVSDLADWRWMKLAIPRWNRNCFSA
jgi:internalin A